MNSFQTLNSKLNIDEPLKAIVGKLANNQLLCCLLIINPRTKEKRGNQ